MTLRSRLTLALVALTAVGLGVAALITYHQVGSYLVRRVDQELAAAAAHPNIIFQDSTGLAGSLNNVPVGTYVESRAQTGFSRRHSPPLDLPPVLPDGPIAGGKVFSTSPPHYRVATIAAKQVFDRLSDIQ